MLCDWIRLIVQPDVDQSNLDCDSEGVSASEHSAENLPPNNNNPHIMLVKKKEEEEKS